MIRSAGTGAFLGSIGALVELTQWAENQTVTTGQEPKYFTGLDGTRTAFMAPAVSTRLREWEVAMSQAQPRQAAAFQALCLGAFGNGPFVFCDPLAQVTNLLTPAQSMLGALGAANRVSVQGLGEMPVVFMSSGALQVVAGVPVRPGRASTASMWVESLEPVTLETTCSRADGTTVATAKKSFDGASGGRWISMTFTPGTDAAQVAVSVRAAAATSVACPALTWTPVAMPWSPGRGALEVVVHGLKEQYDRASASDEEQQLLSYSATVTEVGSGA